VMFCGLVSPGQGDVMFCGLVSPGQGDVMFCSLVSPGQDDSCSCRSLLSLEAGQLQFATCADEP